MGESDGRVKHRPEDALVAGRSGEGALVSEEMVEVLGEHGAHIDARYVHGLTCRGHRRVTLSNSLTSREVKGALWKLAALWSASICVFGHFDGLVYEGTNIKVGLNVFYEEENVC